MWMVSCVAACALCCCLVPPATAQVSPPGSPWNLVVVYVDDLDASIELPALHTPGIDALAARGVRFTRAYAAHPVCNPSRAALLAGQLAHHTQVAFNTDPLPPDGVNGVAWLPRRLRDAGYHSVGIGKIHHEPVPGCWDELHDFVDDPWVPQPPIPHGLLAQGMVSGGPFMNGPAGELGQAADWKRTTRALAELVEGKQRIEQTGQPFSLWLGLTATHDPFIYPEKFLAHYDAADVPPLPPEELAVDWQQDVCPQAFQVGSFYDPQWGATAAEQRVQALLAYYRCIASVDEQVSRVLGRLQALDLSESTIVLLVSDHGYSFSEHAHIGKSCGFEEDVVTPLVLAVPSLPGTHGQAVATPVSQVDVYPTLMELLGLPEAGPLDGESLVPLLLDTSAPHGAVHYTTDENFGFNLTRYVVRGEPSGTALWKLGAWEHDDDIPQVHQLYELSSDPGEYSNRYLEPGLAGTVSELRQELLDVGLLGPGWRTCLHGKPGAAGVPAIAWDGAPVLGGACTLQIGNPTAARAAAVLHVGFSGVAVGTRSLVLPAAALPLVVDEAGLSLPVLLPLEPALHEVPIGLQVVLQDATAPQGYALSRALSVFLSL
jgi:iduronate 2-sulfatase